MLITYRSSIVVAKQDHNPRMEIQPELGTRYLKSSGPAATAIWQKKQRRCRYFKKINSKKKRWHSNTVSNGKISTLFTKVNYSSF